MTTLRPITLAIYAPLDSKLGRNQTPKLLSQFEFASGQCDLQLTTTITEGFSACKVGFLRQERLRYAELGRVPVPLRIPDLPQSCQWWSHVVVMSGGKTIFEGAAYEFDRDGGFINGLVIGGYGTADQLSESPFDENDTTLATSGVILREALLGHTHWVRPGDPSQFRDPGVAHQRSEFNGKYPADIVSQFVQEGQVGAAWMFQVWENRTAWFRPQLTGTRPDYVVPKDERVTQWRENILKTYSDVWLQYQDITNGNADAIYKANRASYYDRYKRTRVWFVTAGQLSPSAARSWAESAVEFAQLPDVSGTIARQRHDPFGTLTAWDGLETVSGQSRAPEEVRAGETAEIAGRLFVIQRTEYDTIQGTATYQVGSVIPDMTELLTKMGQDLKSLKRGINPFVATRDSVIPYVS